MAQTPEELGLITDWKPLGTFFINDLPLEVVDSVEAFKVLPPKGGYASAWWTGLVIAVVFAAVVFCIARFMPAADSKKTFALVAASLIGVLTVGGVIAIGTARQNHLIRLGPIIDFDKATGRVRIPHGKVFERDEIVGLACCSLYHKGSHGIRLAELNLITSEGERQVRHLLTTNGDSSKRKFDYIGRSFLVATGIPVLRIWNEGLFGTGALAAEALEAGQLRATALVPA